MRMRIHEKEIPGKLRRVFGVRVMTVLFVCSGLMVRAADVEEAQYNVVVTLYNAGQWEAALKKIAEREALPDLTEAHRARYQYARGLAYEKGGKTDDARKAYATLIEKYPHAAESRKAGLTVLYMDYAAAQFDAVIQRYEKIDKNSLEAADKRNTAVMYAEALYAGNNIKPALKAYQAALALGADRAAMAVKLFDLYYRTEQYQALLDLSVGGVPGVKEDMAAMVRAEAFLALNKPAEVEKEAIKVPVGSDLYPRTCFTLAQSFIRLNRLKDATAPLEAAVRDMKNPPAPPAALLALSECLLAGGRTNDAEKVLQQVMEKAGNLPDREKQDLLAQAALLKIRLASDSGDARRLIKVIAETRDYLPKDKLPEVLYLKVFGLAQASDEASLLPSMKDDYPLLQGTPREGAATQIYFAALKKAKRLDEGLKLLEEFLMRQPGSAEAPRARLEIANAALQKENYAKARALFKDLLAGASARKTLGAEAYHEALYNSAVVAVKQKENDEAIKTLQALEQAKPNPGLLDKGLRLLGQIYAAKSDYKNAAEIWKRILAGGKVEKEGELREQLAKALFANGDFVGSRTQFEAACPLLGGEAKLTRDSRETWARALFNAGDFPGAAAQYGALHASFKDVPAYAYESAVSYERATNWTETVKWYAVADKDRKALPEAYAAALDASLAKARLQAGSGDQGLSYWLSQLGTNVPGGAFEAAVAVLARTTAAAGAPDSVRTGLEALMKDYAPNGPRYYASGSLLLQWLASNDKKTDLKQWADKLAADLAANEAALPPKTFGSTLAPAMIHFFRGEADRLAGSYADALASYETVLAAYPYNEWPDAAGCRAAECYAALGDKTTAVSKWNEVIKSAGTSPGSAKWRELAAQKVKATQGE